MKRAGVRILVALLVGATATVVVAWGAAWLHPGNRAMKTARCILRDYEIGVFSTPGVTRIVNIPPVLCSDSAARAAMQRLKSTLVAEQSRLIATYVVKGRVIPLPRWSGVHSMEPNGAPAFVENAAGLPFRALIATRSPGDNTSNVAFRDGAIRWSTAPGNGLGMNEYVLPMQPIWCGFLADTICFAALWIVGGALRGVLHRRLHFISRRAVVACAGSCVLAGLMTSVGIAWWLALNVPVGHAIQAGYTRGRGADDHWFVTKVDAGSALRIHSDSRTHGSRVASVIPEPEAAALLGSWAQHVRPDADPDITRVIEARGWPMLAMSGEMRVRSTVIGKWRRRSFVGGCASGPAESIYRRDLEGSRFACVLPVYGPASPFGGVELAPGHQNDRSLYVHYTRVLPWRPLWPGFAVNTAIFSACWLILLCAFLGPRYFVRSHRAKRGRCLVCGYDLRQSNGEQCSECGTLRM